MSFWANDSFAYMIYITWSPASLSETCSALSAPNSSSKNLVRALNPSEPVSALGNTMYSLNLLDAREVVELAVERGTVDDGGKKVVDDCMVLPSDFITEQWSSFSHSLPLPSSPILSSIGVPSIPIMKGGSRGKSNSAPHPNKEPKIDPDPHPVRGGSVGSPPSPATIIP